MNYNFLFIYFILSMECSPFEKNFLPQTQKHGICSKQDVAMKADVAEVSVGAASSVVLCSPLV